MMARAAAAVVCSRLHYSRPWPLMRRVFSSDWKQPAARFRSRSGRKRAIGLTEATRFLCPMLSRTQWHLCPLFWHLFIQVTNGRNYSTCSSRDLAPRALGGPEGRWSAHRESRIPLGIGRDFRGTVRIEPLTVAIDALLADEPAYASSAVHFGPVPAD